MLFLQYLYIPTLLTLKWDVQKENSENVLMTTCYNLYPFTKENPQQFIQPSKTFNAFLSFWKPVRFGWWTCDILCFMSFLSIEMQKISYFNFTSDNICIRFGRRPEIRSYTPKISKYVIFSLLSLKMVIADQFQNYHIWLIRYQYFFLSIQLMK